MPGPLEACVREASITPLLHSYYAKTTTPKWDEADVSRASDTFKYKFLESSVELIEIRPLATHYSAYASTQLPMEAVITS